MTDWQRCPFLCEMRDFEPGIGNQVIGYLCKAQCKDCPAHNNTVNTLQAENEKLKSDLDGQSLVSKIAYADIRKLGDENERLKRELEIQKNLTRQQCFLTEEAYKETDKWKKMFYDLADKQASVSTDPRVVIVGKDNNVRTNAPDNNVGTMNGEKE